MAHPISLTEFQQTVWEYYAQHGRDLPWRKPEPGGSFDAYKILVSEIMLQQTQVPRVIPKYHAFLGKFPTIQTLATAKLGDVLRVWSGLGYNRRAKYLHEAAKILQRKPRPWTAEDLKDCKGIGKNTAAAVCVYAYNQPLIFIETNIRTVYIHHFFHGRPKVADKELAPLLEASLNPEHPREFMWALMDYGTYLKKLVGNLGSHSKHYAKQSAFAGSNRQIRGQVLRLLGQGPLSPAELQKQLSDSRLMTVVSALEHEQLIHLQGKRYTL